MSNIWLKSEGDNWYLRNKESLGKKFDFCLFLLELYSIKPRKVLEIGTSNGYRLAKIHKRYNSDVVGIEPSKRAIKDGQKKYPFIRFINNAYENVETREKFDLIIVNFVFHWVSREDLYNHVYKIDNSLRDTKYLVIGDFGTDNFFQRRYHHLKSTNFYTWKMPYWELFTSSGKYLEIAKIRFNHDSNSFSTNITIDNMGTVVLLKKTNLYIER